MQAAPKSVRLREHSCFAGDHPLSTRCHRPMRVSPKPHRPVTYAALEHATPWGLDWTPADLIAA